MSGTFKDCFTLSLRPADDPALEDVFDVLAPATSTVACYLGVLDSLVALLTHPPSSPDRLQGFLLRFLADQGMAWGVKFEGFAGSQIKAETEGWYFEGPPTRLDPTEALVETAAAILASLPLELKAGVMAKAGVRLTALKTEIKPPARFKLLEWLPEQQGLIPADDVFYFEIPALLYRLNAPKAFNWNGEPISTGTPVDLDFTRYSINGQAARNSAKTTFFNALAKLSPNAVNGRSIFRPYARLKHDGSTYDLLFRRIPAGGGFSGGGVGRADKIEAEKLGDVLWEWPVNDAAHLDLPKLLNLPQQRRLDQNNIDGKPCNVTRHLTTDPKFLLVEVKEGPQTNWYVQTNTPFDVASRLPASNTAQAIKRDVADDTKAILTLFHFRYYRRLLNPPAPPRVAKQLVDGSPRRPGSGDGEPTQEKYIGINPPICFLAPHYIQWAASNRTGRLDLKNKSSVLWQAAGPRADAGGKMKELRGSLARAFQSLCSSSLSATAFVTKVIADSPQPRTDWQDVKATTRAALSVNQEWCHLQGHGDGGTERLGNFVAGSYHCNTEQLAMEDGLRLTTHREKEGTFELRTTAYLLHQSEDSTKAVVVADYLTADSEFQKLQNQHLAQLHPQLAPTDGPALKRQRSVRSGENRLPIAVLLRYKVVRKEGVGQFRKVWDHLFEGQSDFFDQYQYKILNLATRFALAGMAAFKAWYDENTVAATTDRAGT